MTEQRYVACRCVRGSDRTGWSYSKDDLFCPGCGTSIARLVSENQYPPNSGIGPLWVYPVPGSSELRFEVPIYLEFADLQRCVRRRPPRMDVQHAVSTDVQYFGSAVTISDTSTTDPDASNRPLTISLTPRDSVMEAALPAEGVEFRLRKLSGDFSERELHFRIGNTPSVRIEIVGPSIESDPQKGGFVVTASDKLDVKLRVHAIDAPIIIRTEVNRHSPRCKLIQDGATVEHLHVQFELKDTLEAGTEIRPGRPWSGDAHLDTSSVVEGQQISLTVPIEAHVARISRKDWKVEITRIDKGGLKIRPNPLVIPVMFFGECRSNAMNDRTENPEGPDATGDPPVIGRIFVTNLGKATVILDDVASTPKVQWLTTGWSKDVLEGSKRPRSESQIELAPNERGEIYIRIDLREILPQQLNADGSLSAVLNFVESQNPEPHAVQVVVSKVMLRRPCPVPLCIDFGNTNSYAAIRNPDSRSLETPWLRDELIAVHDVSCPERFPTALFFSHVDENSLAAEYEIGTLATTEAEKHGSLVTDLKRWIGYSNHRKTVMSPHGDHQHYSVQTLIVLYLKRVVERAEAILRRFSIHQICVSHPSKYTMKRREAFFAVIDQLCEVVTQERGSELRQVFSGTDDAVYKTDHRDTPRGIDEANAVAVGAVFDSDVQDWLRQLVTPERPYFTVASFDLGGGSLDTAIIRFQVRKGQMDLPRYTTEYLQIGGHDGFGGDHVTLVVFEILRQRIRESLDRAGLPARECLSCIPSPHRKDSADTERRRNYEVLWRVSERIKIHQCMHPDGNTEGNELAGLQHFVRSQLVHDLVLAPTPGGKFTPDTKVQDVLKSFVDSEAYLIPLDSIYRHPMQLDLLGDQEEWTVCGRILQCAEELREFAESKDTAIDLIVRCGAGSRLPLVDEILLKELPNSKIVPDKSSADSKFLVAHGLVRFLDAIRGRHRFARSSDYTSSAFAMGTLENVRTGRIRLIPNCAPVNAPDQWYFPTSVSIDSEEPSMARRLKLDDLHLFAHEVLVYRIDRGRIPAIHGWFDLTREPDAAEGGPGEPLTEDLIEELDPQASVRLTGSENQIELKLSTDSGCLGVWRMILADDGPETPTSWGS